MLKIQHKFTILTRIVFNKYKIFFIMHGRVLF